MITVVYYIAISLIYLLLDVVNDRAAGTLVVAFIALLMVPACYGEYMRVRSRH